MQKAKTFQNLLVWQKAHEFVLSIYKLTHNFPSEEKFGLTSQMRRASISIAANIVEGFPKRGIKDKLRFYNISQGSLEECRYFLILTKDLDYSKDISFHDNLLSEVSYLLNSYCKVIRKQLNN